jgi:hypothetical protein
MSAALALAALPDVYELPPITTEVSATLPVGAPVAFEAFADVAQTPRWLSVVSSTRVLEADLRGRPLRASFLARLERATIGYVLHYTWDDDGLGVRWSTADASSLRISGDARFAPLSARACLMHYRLTLEVPVDSGWINESFSGNAAAAVASEFREHLRRLG